MAINNEYWQWDTGFTPIKEGELLKDADHMMCIALDQVQKADAVAFAQSGDTWKYPQDGAATALTSGRPKVAACGSAVSIEKDFAGFARQGTDSGEACPVQMRGVYCARTTKRITGNKWVRPAHYHGINLLDKMGEVYQAEMTGELLIGQALNETEAPTTLGTGTSTSKYNCHPVVILMRVQAPFLEDRS